MAFFMGSECQIVLRYNRGFYSEWKRDVSFGLCL